MTVPEIDVDELARLHESGVVLVDVREVDEYVEERIPGVVHIPLAQLPERVDDVPADQTVYVVCAVGGRSMKAAEWLRTKGVDAVNVAGGTKAWVASGRRYDAGA